MQRAFTSNSIPFVFFSKLTRLNFIKKGALWKKLQTHFYLKKKIKSAERLKIYSQDRSVFLEFVLSLHDRNLQILFCLLQRKPKEEVLTGNWWKLGRRIRKQNLLRSIIEDTVLSYFFHLGLEFYI